MAVRNPHSMARPPMRGVGMVCTSRLRTSPTAPRRIARWRTIGVNRYVAHAATKTMNR